MGIYNWLPKGSQVKLWDSWGEVNIGDTVPNFDVEKYVVLLREGGYVLVKKGVITEIVEYSSNCKCKKNCCPKDFPGVKCLDKWGNVVTSADELIGELDVIGIKDPYYREGD